LITQQIRDSDGRQSFTRVVRHHDLVDANCFPERDGGAGAGDPTLGDALCVRCVDVNADSVPSGPSVYGGGHTPESFSKDDMGATVENSDDLSISFDRHPCNGALCRNFKEFDSHLACQFTATG
jgi:hypothetical protein